jgi:hypothetical protein
MNLHRLLRLSLPLLAGLLTACSSFDQRWKDAGAPRPIVAPVFPQQAMSPSRWDGEWRSGKNVYVNGAYHHGRLRCVLEPQPDRSLKAYFHANWLMFSGNYDLTLQPVKKAGKTGKVSEYEGTHDLPSAFGGRYQYQATISGSHFKAKYTCRIDQGVFLLHRVP